MSRAAVIEAEPPLVRAIGVRGLTANIVNSTIGAGIFVLPALIDRDLGTAAPLAYVACALAMMLVVASFAMAGSRVSLTGGIYAYVGVAFGPLVGFVIGFLVWLSCLLAAASVANALAASIALIVPALANPIARVMGLGIVFGAFAFINVRGVAIGTRVVEAVTLAKLLPLVLLVAVGLLWVRPEDLAVDWVSPGRVGAASITLIFAFVGVEIALVPSGEIRAPSQTVPRALFLALAITTAMYLALQLVAHAVLGNALAQSTAAPLADAALRVLGPWGRTLMIVGGSVSMLGFLSGDALGSPRSLFAFARDGLLPRPLARIHSRFRTPAAAIVTHAAIAWCAASIGSFGALALLSNVALLSCYVLCCAAALELRRRNVRGSGAPFKVPGGPVVPVVACMVLVWLLSNASAQEYAVTAAAAGFAVMLYVVRALRANGRPAVHITPADA